MGGEEEREADARRPRTAGGAASRWVVHSDRYVAAYFKGSQDRRNVFVDGRSGPDRVPGNLFPAREIYFPGINIPKHNAVFSMQIFRQPPGNLNIFCSTSSVLLVNYPSTFNIFL